MKSTFENANIIVNMVHGSHLYGLNTENSDTDYKGIFLPTKEEIYLGGGICELRKSTGDRHAKNTSDDIDTVLFSLHKFIKMACDGDTVALDMIHSETTLQSSPIWDFIRENRSRFYTKNMKAYYGYCSRQASKYGVKGSKLKALEDLINYLKTRTHCTTLSHPLVTMGLEGLNIQHPKFIKVMYGFTKGDKFVNKHVLDVCGAKYDLTCGIQYVIAQLTKMYDSYGERANLAKQNLGVDFKAISHAIRAGLQLKEIYQTGDLKYPLKDADFLLRVKKGELHFMNDVSPVLESLMDELKALTDVSSLPENVDRDFWNQWLIDVYDNSFRGLL